MKINFVRRSSGKRTSITISDSLSKLWLACRLRTDSDGGRAALKERMETLSDPAEGVTFQQLAESLLVNDVVEFQSRLLESKENMKNRVIDELLSWLLGQVEPDSSVKDVLAAISDFKKLEWAITEKFQSLDIQRY